MIPRPTQKFGTSREYAEHLCSMPSLRWLLLVKKSAITSDIQYVGTKIKIRTTALQSFRAAIFVVSKTTESEVHWKTSFKRVAVAHSPTAMEAGDWAKQHRQQKGELLSESSGQRHSGYNLERSTPRKSIQPALLGRKVSQEPTPEIQLHENQSPTMSAPDMKRKKRSCITDAFVDIGRDLASLDVDATTEKDRNGRHNMASHSRPYEQEDCGRAQGADYRSENDRQYRLGSLGGPKQRSYLEGFVDSDDAMIAPSTLHASKRRPRSENMLDPFGQEDGSYERDNLEYMPSVISQGRSSAFGGAETLLYSCDEARVFPGHAEHYHPRKAFKYEDPYDQPSYHYESTFHFPKPTPRINARSRGRFPIRPMAQKILRTPAIAQKGFRASRNLHKRNESEEAVFDFEGSDEEIGKRFVYKPTGFSGGHDDEDDDDLYKDESLSSERLEPNYDGYCENSLPSKQLHSLWSVQGRL